METIDIAQTCYAANREYCRAMNDYSLSLWIHATEEVKTGYENAVLFHIANPLITGEQSHDKWMESKFAAGWKYGPEKDFDKKQHPSMIPYHLLTEGERVKDLMFKAITHALNNK